MFSTRLISAGFMAVFTVCIGEFVIAKCVSFIGRTITTVATLGALMYFLSIIAQGG